MKRITFFIVAGFILWAIPSYANMTQIKAYKDAYPDAKPKCIECHVDKMPKKDDGAHELNDYGKAALKAAKDAKLDTATADSYKAVGTIEDFAKKAAPTK